MVQNRRVDESGPLPQFQVELSDADRTLEYRKKTPGPDDRIASQLPSLVAQAIERAKTLDPIIRDFRPSERKLVLLTGRRADATQDLDVDVEALEETAKPSPDASLQFPHPVDPALFADETGELFEPTRQMPTVRRDPRVMLAGFAAVLTVAAIILGLGLASRSAAQTTAAIDKAAEVPLPGAAPEPAKKLEPVEAPPAKPEEKPLPTTGTITSPTWTTGRRIFVDAKMVGQGPKVEVACGPHLVRIGSAGKTRKIDVPCGGTIHVTP